MKCLKTSFCGCRLRRLLLSALFLPLVVALNSCMATEQTLDKIRNNTERSAIAGETLVRIEGKFNKNNKDVQNLVSIFEDSLKNVKQPEPFEIPDWLIILGCTIAGFLFPDFAKKAGQGAIGGIKMIKKVMGNK